MNSIQPKVDPPKVYPRNPSGFGILLTFLILILALVGCEKGTLGIRFGSVSGVVLDSKTLAGVSGVNVIAESGTGNDKSTKYSTTDTRGNYYMSDLRAGEWTIGFDKAGYTPVALDASAAIKVVVVNNEHRNLPEIRMFQNYLNQYINIKGTLKDFRNGTLITMGMAQFIFGNQTFNNRLPTEFQTGFSVPAQNGELSLSIKVTGFETYTTTVSGITDIDLGVIMLKPQSYKIIGIWKDVPGWVLQEGPSAAIVAYSGNRIVSTTTARLNAQSFELENIPMGTSVSLEIQIKGFRLNGPIPIVPNSDFQGTIYQNVSLKSNFAQIMRDVRVIVNGTGIGNNDRVGAYCNQTGAVWPTTIVTNIGFLTNPRVIDLGVNQCPTGYSLTFTGFVVEDGTTGQVSVVINDDGVDPQVVTIPVS